MKGFVLIFALAVFSAATDNGVASEVTARISVRSEGDIIALAEYDVEIHDARIQERVDVDGSRRYRIKYLPENGYVTVSASKSTLDRIRANGYEISHIREATPPGTISESVGGVTQIPYQFGWPRTIYNGMTLYENSPTIADMDLDGNLDVSVTNAWGSYSPPNPPHLIVWRYHGAYLNGFPVPLEAGQFQSSADAGISAIGDIFGDDKLEIVCGDENGFLYAFHHDGTALNGFPKSFGAWTGVFTPALADVDGDGKMDIAVISHDWDFPYGNAFLHLFKVTENGPVEFPGYPIDLQRGAENSPAIGDLDGDGRLEIVVATGGASDSTVLAKVIAYTDSGQVVNGFPWVIGKNSAYDSPTLYDINNDGTLEILIRIAPDFDVNGVYAIDDRGSIVPGFPFPISSGNSGVSVAVGDMDGDNIPEIAYGSVQAVDSGKVWVWDLNGNLLPGFPANVFRTWVDGSVAIGDLDGDGLGDVVCGTNGTISKPGMMRAFNYQGQELPGFPISPGSPILNSFITHPTLVDIDGDGDTEIFAGRQDQYVYGWDTEGIYDSTNVWSTFKGNAARTGGQLVSPHVVSIKNGISRRIPEQFELQQNYPNPFNPSTKIKFAIPIAGRPLLGGVRGGSVSLKVYDISGKEIATLLNEEKPPGEYEIEFDASHLPSGVYLYRLTAGSFSETRKMILLR